MYHRGALCLFFGADGGKHGRHTSSYRISHDNRDGGAVGYLSGHGKRLQNTDRSGTGLNNRCQECACKEPEKGIFKHQKELLKLRHIRKTGYRRCHRFHPEHQRGETEKNHTGILFGMLFGKHVQNNADKRQYRREGGGLEQFHPHAVPADSAE